MNEFILTASVLTSATDTEQSENSSTSPILPCKQTEKFPEMKFKLRGFVTSRSHFSLIGLCLRYFIGPSNLCRIGFHFIGP
ncbi:hypothetical protein T01_14721 [Trichinella spiralis]|uniref:Uncharacterized protein n=1 Tax=Trichinella spiralis TaxID=6334 RepID=A0A0V1AJR6_TRISP|nr:hypothetical protein T01_14721 [Trichinella spiralis]